MKKRILLAGALFLGTLTSSLQAQAWHETTYRQGLSFIVNSDRIQRAESFRILYGSDRQNLFEANTDKINFNTLFASLKLDKYNLFYNGQGGAFFNLNTDEISDDPFSINTSLKGSQKQLLFLNNEFFTVNSSKMIFDLKGVGSQFSVKQKGSQLLKVDDASLVAKSKDIKLISTEKVDGISPKIDLSRGIADMSARFVKLRGGVNSLSINKTNVPEELGFYTDSKTSSRIIFGTGEGKERASFGIAHGSFGNEIITVKSTVTDIKTQTLRAKDIVANKVTLKVGSFPDYVFANDYRLMPLAEVATYIKTNKHLPNMPSEKEVVANGMNLEEITLKLVEKVEELTLHTINQQKLIEKLQEKLSTTKK